MLYKNCGCISQTFYNIEIKPGETKDFPGYVNSINLIRVFSESKLKSVEPKVTPKRKYTKRTSKPNIKETPKPLEISDDNNEIKQTDISEEKN